MCIIQNQIKLMIFLLKTKENFLIKKFSKFNKIKKKILNKFIKKYKGSKEKKKMDYY